MPTPGVHVETLQNPSQYAREQIERACVIAYRLNRGRFLLVEPPKR